jgi:hypothetical protein
VNILERFACGCLTAIAFVLTLCVYAIVSLVYLCILLLPLLAVVWLLQQVL